MPMLTRDHTWGQREKKRLPLFMKILITLTLIVGYVPGIMLCTQYVFHIVLTTSALDVVTKAQKL